MENHPAVHDPPASATDDQDILDNIDGRMHGPMSGFIKKHFGSLQYAHEDAFLEIQVAGRVGGRYAVPSTAPSPDDFLQWFSNYVSRELDGARGSWHISGDNVAPEYESDDDGARLLLTMPTLPASGVQTGWDHVQVIGQFYRRGGVSYQDGLLRLCRSAHQVFASQPTRLFLHGFYIRGSLIELWVFDRSGLYCSDLFDMQKDFIQFLSIILSYQRMTDQELGKINIIETDEGSSYVVLNNKVMPSLGKLYLENRPIASREGLVGTGTTCYRARVLNSDRWNYVLKFKWRWARDRPEDELLKLARKKCVWGAVSLDYYEEVESTANLRRGLRWGTHRKFARVQSRERNRSIEEQRQEGTCNTDGLVAYTEETDNFFQNRILACIVTSPVGRPLHTFQSLLELLQVFRDAIKCHRSLYYDGKILHQDVSPGNMIILDDQDEGKPQGILIDLDSAIELAEGLETDLGVTGTRPFMAIGVLKSECHTYRHDLESFLYVFLWIIITNRTESPPETSKLRQWSNGDWDEIAVRKSHDMDQNGFQAILGEFTPEFHSLKPLAECLRQILFPLRAGVIWTGTDSSPEATDKLYDEMIRVFEEGIAFEGRRQT
ncbi:FunK1 protein kinase [Annulohypoxylon truncatum]|uniref:FunK1 protein kinase n=1 Tax=Annulohypoxylon truncatum TaxID=327061 RepID=UPI0020078B17|nr:FunK1 protein kinase [Annulohypoxylon truncatum]KAI1205533.1 FunK1 protein kinase [Annulohypoxylon truncatum]